MFEQAEAGTTSISENIMKRTVSQNFMQQQMDNNGNDGTNWSLSFIGSELEKGLWS